MTGTETVTTPLPVPIPGVLNRVAGITVADARPTPPAGKAPPISARIRLEAAEDTEIVPGENGTYTVTSSAPLFKDFKSVTLNDKGEVVSATDKDGKPVEGPALETLKTQAKEKYGKQLGSTTGVLTAISAIADSVMAILSGKPMDAAKITENVTKLAEILKTNPDGKLIVKVDGYNKESSDKFLTELGTVLGVDAEKLKSRIEVSSASSTPLVPVTANGPDTRPLTAAGVIPTTAGGTVPTALAGRPGVAVPGAPVAAGG